MNSERAFGRQSWVRNLIMGGRRSRAQRKAAFIRAHMRAGDDWIEVTIGNISASGAMIKTLKAPSVGWTVELRRRNLAMSGRVVWATRSRFGLASDEPIDVDDWSAGPGFAVKAANRREEPTQKLWHWRRG